MSPWSRAEAEGEVNAPEEETFERDLFARRERALESAGTVGAIPALAVVLRAADVSREARVERSARGRSFVAMALAAACFTAALTKLPQVETHPGAIAADMDAGPPRAGMLVEETAAETCAAGDYPFTAAPAEPRACFPPAPTFSFATAASLVSVATFTPVTPAPAEPAVEATCESDESARTPR